MVEFLTFLDFCRQLRRRVETAQGLRKLPRSRPIVDRIFNIWLDGYHAGLTMAPDELIDELSLSSPSDTQALFDGAFCGVAAAYLGKGGGREEIHQLIADCPPGTAASMGLGIGAALSHLEVDMEICPQITKQPWGWLCMDSYGFHEAYYHWWTRLIETRLPKGVAGDSRRPFDQGVGRAIWVIGQANPQLMASYTERFDVHRQADLWNGIGLMAALWGMSDEADYKRLLAVAKHNRVHLQLGVALATMMRVNNKDVADHTEGGCNIICEAKSADVARMATQCLQELPQNCSTSSFFDRLHFYADELFAGSNRRSPRSLRSLAR